MDEDFVKEFMKLDIWTNGTSNHDITEFLVNKIANEGNEPTNLSEYEHNMLEDVLNLEEEYQKDDMKASQMRADSLQTFISLALNDLEANLQGIDETPNAATSAMEGEEAENETVAKRSAAAKPSKQKVKKEISGEKVKREKIRKSKGLEVMPDDLTMKLNLKDVKLAKNLKAKGSNGNEASSNEKLKAKQLIKAKKIKKIKKKKKKKKDSSESSSINTEKADSDTKKSEDEASAKDFEIDMEKYNKSEAFRKMLKEGGRPNPQQVLLGPNNTRIARHAYHSINWSTADSATRGLLSNVFDRKTLAMYLLPLDLSEDITDISEENYQDVMTNRAMQDVVYTIRRRFNISEAEVRKIIQCKCSGENKMYRYRMHMLHAKTQNGK